MLAAGLLLSAVPAAVFAAPNLPNDQFLSQQLWYYQMTNIDKAWEVKAGDPNIVVAVIDDGIDMQHPDLIGNIWRNVDEVPGNGIDDDRNGYADDFYGWDFSISTGGPIQDINYFPGVLKGADKETLNLHFKDALRKVLNENPGLSDEELIRRALRKIYFNHGTPVASVIGAKGNNVLDLAGTMWNVQLMSVPFFEIWKLHEGIVLSLPPAFELKLAEAIRYAVDNGADVINLSVRIPEVGNSIKFPILESSLKYAYENGVVIIAAAGNDGIDLGMVPFMPACSQYVLTVGAVDNRRNRAGFSNYGSCVDVYAPGEEMRMLYYGFDWNESLQKTVETRTWISDAGSRFPTQVNNGTSFAAPLMAGIAGLLKSKYPLASPQEIYDRIIQTAQSPLFYPPGGGYIVDAHKALTAGPLGPEVGEGSLLKNEETGKIYVIESGERRHILSAEAFILNGYRWENVLAVPADYLERFPIGEPVGAVKGVAAPSIPDGALIRANREADIWIVKYVGDKKFKRLILSPTVFESYGHLRWEDVMDVDRSVVDSFITSNLVRAAGDERVYQLFPEGDTGQRRWVRTAEVFVRLGLDWNAVYEINAVDRDSYIEGSPFE